MTRNTHWQNWFQLHCAEPTRQRQLSDIEFRQPSSTSWRNVATAIVPLMAVPSSERARTIRAGFRLKSSVDTVEVMVVRAPAAPSIVRCGDAAMHVVADSTSSEPTDSDAGVQPGQRLCSEETGEFEVLVLRGGSHSLSIDGRPLRVRDAPYDVANKSRDR